MFTNTWAGDCSAWECDELGHLNMSFYFDKFEQARMGLFIRLGLVGAFAPGAVSTVRSRDAHIKYLAEARPGSPLRVESAIVALHETTARVGHVMYHRDGRIAATLNELVEHVYLPEDKLFRWPSRLRGQADRFTDQMPAPARARNLSLDTDLPGHSAEALTQAGAPSIGGGVFRT
ncbi:MAG: thioesterase family protein, partial [Litorimonas sp.]